MSALKLNSRKGYEIRTAIKERLDFTTHGALAGGATAHYKGAGILGEEQKRFHADYNTIVYSVYSYSTPIAWETADGTVYIVKQKFSATTSKHQTLAKSLESAKTAYPEVGAILITSDPDKWTASGSAMVVTPETAPSTLVASLDEFRANHPELVMASRDSLW